MKPLRPASEGGVHRAEGVREQASPGHAQPEGLRRLPRPAGRRRQGGRHHPGCGRGATVSGPSTSRPAHRGRTTPPASGAAERFPRPETPTGRKLPVLPHHRSNGHACRWAKLPPSCPPQYRGPRFCVRNTPLNWSPLTESSRRPSPYIDLQFVAYRPHRPGPVTIPCCHSLAISPASACGGVRGGVISAVAAGHPAPRVSGRLLSGREPEGCGSEHRCQVDQGVGDV